MVYLISHSSFVSFLRSSPFRFFLTCSFVLCSYVFVQQIFCISQYKLCAAQCLLILNLSSKRGMKHRVCVYLTISLSENRLFTINKSRRICALNMHFGLYINIKFHLCREEKFFHLDFVKLKFMKPNVLFVTLNKIMSYVQFNWSVF